jgi:hypothetical protein
LSDMVMLVAAGNAGLDAVRSHSSSAARARLRRVP